MVTRNSEVVCERNGTSIPRASSKRAAISEINASDGAAGDGTSTSILYY